MIKGRENNKASGGVPADLLVCFPSRAHFTLMPKPICSPARASSEPNKRHHHNNHHLKRLNNRAAITSGAGPGSPLIWAKNNQIRGGGPESSEPTSPKVTCAGQIKVSKRSSTTGCRNWQSVMEEIERIHNRTKNKKKSSSWGESFGFKKDVMNFLTCLRNVRFDFRCFGSFPGQDISSDEDEDEDDVEYEEEDSFKEIIDDDHNEDDGNDNSSESNSNAVFSKWFMVLQENNNQSNNNIVTSSSKHSKDFTQECKEDGNDDFTPVAPPKNALLLMRCRSAPASKKWLEDRENEMKENKEECDNVVEEMVIKDELIKEDVKVEEKKKKKRETLAIVMKYDTDFHKLSPDIAQETWVVDGFKNHFSRSRSWRR